MTGVREDAAPMGGDHAVSFDRHDPGLVGSLAHPEADVPMPTTSIEFEASDHVAGVTLFNDVSIRDLQRDRRASDLLSDVPTLIADLSTVMTLPPGNIIATGAPSGIAAGLEPPRWLRDGDVVELEAPGLGLLRNRFVASGAVG